MSFQCQYCSKQISTKGNLKKHHQTISCLKAQSKLEKAPSINLPSLYCKYCNKKFSRKDTLDNHELVKCTFKDVYSEMRSEIESLKKQLEEHKTTITLLRIELEITSKKDKETINRLESQHQTLALTAITRPTTRNTIKNSTIQNLLPLKDSEINEHVPFLTIDHIKQGPEGYAKFALTRPLKDRITCTDVSRKKLAWKNEAGEIIYDTEGQTLCKKFFAAIQEKGEQLFRELIRDLGKRLDNAYNCGDQEESDAIIELTDKIQTWRREAFQTSKGSATDLSADFAHYLCKMSAIESGRSIITK